MARSSKKRISTGFCSLTTMHMNAKHEIDFKYNSSTRKLDQLRSTYGSNHNIRTEGVIELNYRYGKPKLREEYNSSLELTGERKAFYSNGQLMLVEQYNKGLKNGPLTWYYRNGKIHRTSIFKEGKEICETYYYDHVGRLRKINYLDDED